MRTTLNIDDEILSRLKREAERSRCSFRGVVNRVLRLGLEQVHPQDRRAPFRCTTFRMGFPPLPDLDKALHLAARLEDDEIVHKLALRR